jgi:hypothetical protein
MNAGPPIPDELWQQIPPAAQVAILALIQHYQQHIADLEARLNQNSTNSSSHLLPTTPTPSRSVLRGNRHEEPAASRAKPSTNVLFSPPSNASTSSPVCRRPAAAALHF